MEGRTHEFAFALLAAVHVQLHGLDDGVVVGEVFVVSHAADSRIGACGASTDKSGQRRTSLKSDRPNSNERDGDLSPVTSLRAQLSSDSLLDNSSGGAQCRGGKSQPTHQSLSQKADSV